MSKEMLGGCCVCSDDRGWPENPLVYCDGQGCNVAVHQACYGIVTVPSGPWFCRKCELKERPRCELCPSKEGAFKKTDSNSWAHVVCALYIPEVRFGNVTTMEPILISLIPQERFNKTCYICEESRSTTKANMGACMQCNKAGCRSTFHVTCAQMLGLLCEEAGNMMDNVKYCGYCQHHYAKLVRNKATRHVKIIPPYRPVPANNSRSVSPASVTEKPVTHGPKSTGGNSSGEDGKSASNNLATLPGAASTPQSSSSEGGKSSSNISPDINSSCSSKPNSKNSKKGSSSYHGVGGSKSSSSTILDNSKGGGSSTVSHERGEVKGKGHGKEKTSESDHHPTSRCEDSLAVKLERLEDKTASKSGFGQKKDFSNIQLKEVVAAALDRPMTNTPGSKFENSSSSLTSGLDGPTSSIPPGPSSVSSSHSHGSRHSHGPASKIAPPDIKPDVTLTPIPMKPNATARHSSSKDDDRDAGDRESVCLSKSPGANIPFHHSFGAPPKLQNQNQQVSPDISEATSKGNKPPELTAQEDISVSSDNASTGPPSKRARGISRDEDREREQRRTPTKGRGGRRGSTTGNSFTRREVRDGTSAAAFVDDSSFDDIIEANGSVNSSATEKRERPPSGRKNGTVTRSSKPPEDPPAPTLSQLRAASGIKSGPPPVGLAPHMFGNALNPSSSMAMKMVDTLSEEMEAVVSAGGVPEVVQTQTALVGIPLPGSSKPTATNVPATSNGSTASGAQTPPQTLEQLLERQWEQGSQFLMEQAQHLDIAQLLSCLNQLKQDNKALEEHVQSLIQRRDQLTAINARLSIPLGNSSALGSLGGSFAGGPSNATAHHNGHGINQNTTASNVHPFPPGPGGVSKNHLVANSAPSPQQNDHGGPHHSRDRYNGNSDGGRNELVVTHSSQGGGTHPGHQNHGGHVGIHRSQMMDSSYNSYGAHPVPVANSLSSPHSHPPNPNHPQARGGR